MTRKVSFIGYFFLVLLLFVMIPLDFSNLSNQSYASLFFSYRQKPLLLLLMSLVSLFFDYLSLVIPQSELSTAATLIRVRKPASVKRYLSYARFSLVYLLPFLMIKAYAIMIWNSAIAWFCFLMSLAMWLICMFILSKLPANAARARDCLIFLMCAVIRLVAYPLFQ
ncbi:hypothetical protein U7537_10840 [Lacticaseibacillus rhamnosus]|uniref:Uncharacterized protein n=1 Tax=Lacticaseibacillus rhamnosus TaxID=47715 RepID=A0AAX0K0S5_LACRH|nr:hypothetical protein [Lacticaseibacillus rhamnosus]ONN73787.1 hypothetical protein BWR10_12895 [Lacticaseibacillus rhamnosus]